MIKKSTDTFFTQVIDIKIIPEERNIFFINKIKNKSTIHYGCADWPIYKESNNLHLILTKENSNIDGYDLNADTINLMKQSDLFPKESLYHEVPNKKYDFILVPETIEHVNNTVELLSDISKNANFNTEILITAPNAFCDTHINRNILNENEWKEIVHPDHNFWFSPYTLYNTINKIYIELGYEIEFSEIGLLANKTMTYCIFKIKNDNLMKVKIIKSGLPGITSATLLKTESACK